MTYNELVSDILTELNVLASGETADPNDAALVLNRVNMMRDAWNAEKLMVYEIRQEQFTLIVGQQSYTIGPTGDFITTRPVKIEGAILIDTTADPNLRYPLMEADEDRWVSRRWDPEDQFPSEFYYDRAFPLGILNLSDRPTVALAIELSVWTPWTTALVLGDTVSLPPAYYELALYNGALRCANAFGVTPNPLLVLFASKSRAKVKALNSISPRLTSDAPYGLSR